MILFVFDNTFDGLLCCLFEAYRQKRFPDRLLSHREPLPLFYDQKVEIITDAARADRVWKGVRNKISRTAATSLTVSWLGECPEIATLLFRYMRKALDAPRSIETDFADPDVLAVSQWSKKVAWEKSRVLQFMRFQKISDGTYVGVMEPLYDVLPATLPHFRDRFSDQPWMVYDLKRNYGYYYDLHETREIRFPAGEFPIRANGRLESALLDENEQLFQQLWKKYYAATTIRERANPKVHRQFMPVRFWKYLTEKQNS